MFSRRNWEDFKIKKYTRE